MSIRTDRPGLRELLIATLFLPFLLGFTTAGGDSDLTHDTYTLTFTAVDGAGPGAFESAVVESTFTMFGLTWTGIAPEEVWYRASPATGRWSDWTSFDVSSDDLPDPGGNESDYRRSSTDLIYAGPNEQIQFRLSGNVPRDVELVVFDTSGGVDAANSPFVEEPELSLSEMSVPSMPVIRPRTDWDPTNRCPPREIPEEIQVTTAIVHHTGGTNRAYYASEVPNIILGYCLYHRNTLEFDDIAYNFLIDRFGGIWEGRAGGIDKGIRGGHAKGFSSYSTGIVMIGNFEGASPTWAQRAALEHLLAWKLSVHNLDPLGMTNLISMGSYKYDEGVPVTLNTISGHRDVQATACPGIYAYNLLPTFRSDVASVWRPPAVDYYANPVTGDFDGDGAEEGAVYRRTDGTWWVYDGGSSNIALDGPDGQAVDGAIGADVDGDGSDEIVVRSGASVSFLNLSEGALASTGVGSLGSASDWSVDVGDVDGDGHEDAVFVDGSGSVRVLSAGAIAPWGSIGAGHQLSAIGDFDGDGRDDLAGLRSTGAVDVALSNGTGFGSAGVWGDAGPEGGWQYLVAGDLDGDGDDDVAAFRSSTNTWYGLRSNTSLFASMRPIETPTLDHWSEAFPFDYQDDGIVEVVALNAYTGTWHLGRFDGFEPVFTRLEDAPHRTTVVRNESGEGTSYLSWFGQEFSWEETDLGYGVGDEADATRRIFGASRYESAARISRAAFASADVVFVGTGERYPDALTGGSAAVRLDAPMLLTSSVSLPESTRAEIERLHPDRIVLLGGPAAVSTAVEAELAALAPDGVLRIGGTDRYETAAMISRTYFAPSAGTVYVATGLNFPDALAGVPGAGSADAPILLVRTGSVPATTAAEIRRLAPSEIVILGGPVAVSESVAQSLTSYAPTVRRLYGHDRYGTAAAISAEGFASGADIAYIAVGTNFPDAVAAGPAAAHLGGVLLLSRSDTATAQTTGELRRLRVTRITVIGDENIISEEAIDDLEGIGIGGLTSRMSNLPRP